jgi:hypothetical protein
MIDIGTPVRILPPFAEAFSATYTVTHMVTHEDGQQCCFLLDAEGRDIGAFDPKFLALMEE